MRRPQTPQKPYRYDEREVTYENAAGRVKLAGTLTVPRGEGPFPAVLLISGSGPQDRDEALLGHRPFLVLADHLTRQGIAVLRVDDRGVGGSTGDWLAATMEDAAGDVRAF
jgi:predicted acyl esterase